MLFETLFNQLVLGPAFEPLRDLASPRLLILGVFVMTELFVHDIVLEGLLFLIFQSVDYLPFWMESRLWRL